MCRSDLVRPRGCVVLVAALAEGCAHDAAYVPVGPGTGGLAARTPIPPEAPQGEVYVTSFGFTDMDVAPDRTVGLLHARLVVANHGPEAWSVDGREQILQPPGQPVIVPAFLNTDAKGGPLYTLAAGELRVFDLYYALPSPLDRPTTLQSFELLWRVHVGAQSIGQRTAFERFEGVPALQEPSPEVVFVQLGWGPLWWYGPRFAYGRPPVIRTYYYPPRRARIVRPSSSG